MNPWKSNRTRVAPLSLSERAHRLSAAIPLPEQLFHLYRNFYSPLSIHLGLLARDQDATPVNNFPPLPAPTLKTSKSNPEPVREADSALDTPARW